MRHGIKLIFEHMTQKDVRSIVPLDAGITNDNYLINNAFVLRYVPKDVDPTIDRKLEKLKVSGPMIINLISKAMQVRIIFPTFDGFSGLYKIIPIMFKILALSQ